MKVLCFAGLLLLTCGCSGQNWQAETAPVTGYITVNDQVPQGAIVSLHPVGESVDKRGSRPSGIVQEDGRYTLTTYEFGDGAPAGEYIVTVYWPEKPELGGLSPDRLGLRYATTKSSDLRLSVAGSGAPLKPIAIEGAKFTMSDEKAKGKATPARNPFPGPQKSAAVAP